MSDAAEPTVAERLRCSLAAVCFFVVPFELFVFTVFSLAILAKPPTQPPFLPDIGTTKRSFPPRAWQQQQPARVASAPLHRQHASMIVEGARLSAPSTSRHYEPSKTPASAAERIVRPPAAPSVNGVARLDTPSAMAHLRNGSAPRWSSLRREERKNLERYPEIVTCSSHATFLFTRAAAAHPSGPRPPDTHWATCVRRVHRATLRITFLGCFQTVMSHNLAAVCDGDRLHLFGGKSSPVLNLPGDERALQLRGVYHASVSAHDVEGEFSRLEREFGRAECMLKNRPLQSYYRPAPGCTRSDEDTARTRDPSANIQGLPSSLQVIFNGTHPGCLEERADFQACEFDGKVGAIMISGTTYLFMRANFGAGRRWVQLTASSDLKTWSDFRIIRMDGVSEAAVSMYHFNPHTWNSTHLLGLFPADLSAISCATRHRKVGRPQSCEQGEGETGIFATFARKEDLYQWSRPILLRHLPATYRRVNEYPVGLWGTQLASLKAIGDPGHALCLSRGAMLSQVRRPSTGTCTLDSSPS